MKNPIILISFMALLQGGLAQQFSLGVQSVNGFSSFRSVTDVPAMNITPFRGFATGVGLFGRWDMKNHLGLSLHAQLLHQRLFFQALGENNITGFPRIFIPASYSQGALTLEFFYGIPLSNHEEDALLIGANCDIIAPTEPGYIEQEHIGRQFDLQVGLAFGL